MTDKNCSTTLPAGAYFIGDPCYAIPNDRWMEWLEAAKYDQPKGRWMLDAKLGSYRAVGMSTAYGDGVYLGSDNHEYGVDAGMIGAVPLTISTEKQSSHLGTVVYFDRDFTISRTEEGTITIGHIVIETGDVEDNECCDNCGDELDNGTCWNNDCSECPDYVDPDDD